MRLVLENTGEIVRYYAGRGTGNSSTSYPAGTINSFTAQVVDDQGVVVNSSLKDSHDVTRLDCNVCHTKGGRDGAPGRITSYDYYNSLATPKDPVDINISSVTNTSTPGTPVSTTTTSTTPTSTTSSTPDTSTPTSTTTTTPSASVSFASSVMPVLESNCKACHSGSRTFKVSDTTSTYNNITSNYLASSGDNSVLLKKASGMGHGGGTILNVTDSGYQTLRDWIAQGALNN